MIYISKLKKPSTSGNRLVLITTAQLHSTKHELRFREGLDPARGVSEICDGGVLWQWSWLEIMLNVFRRSTILQKQFIVIISSSSSTSLSSSSAGTRWNIKVANNGCYPLLLFAQTLFTYNYLKEVSNAETMVKYKGTSNKKTFTFPPSDFQSLRCELLNVRNLVGNKLWTRNEKTYRHKRIKLDSTVSYLVLIKKSVNWKIKETFVNCSFNNFVHYIFV